MLQCQQSVAACTATATSLRGRLVQLQPLSHARETSFGSRRGYMSFAPPSASPLLQRAETPAQNAQSTPVPRYPALWDCFTRQVSYCWCLSFLCIPRHSCAPAQCQGRDCSSAPTSLPTSTLNLHSQVLCALIHALDRQGPKCSALSIVHTVFLHIYKIFFCIYI